VALFLSFYILRKYQSDLGSEFFKANYSSLVDGLNTQTKLGLFWNPLVLLRWTLTNTVLVVFKSSFKL
jgi:hypothetical protein